MRGLNDKILSRDSESGVFFSVIAVNSDYPYLKLTDSATTKTEKYFTVDSQTGLWTLTYSTTTHSVTGGCITGGVGKHDGRQGGGVYISKGNFTMDGGNIVGNSAYSTVTNDLGGGVYVHGSSDTTGSFTMFGGNIVGNSANSGAGVYVGKYGTFTMKDGSIESNTATVKHGGGVDVHGGTFMMSGGSIESNTAELGAGVYIDGVSDDSGTFMMSGGSIKNNTAKKDTTDPEETGLGGGVYVAGTFTMSAGAEITENTATNNGGGVYVKTPAAFNISGHPVIGDNTKNGKANNVYLKDGVCITVTGEGLDNAEIWIANPETTSDAAFAKGTGTYNVKEDDAACFHPDTGFAGVKVDTSNNQLKWDTNPALIKYGDTEYNADNITGSESPFYGKAEYTAETNTLKLTDNVTLEPTLTIVAPKSRDKPFTIDLNGKILQRNSDDKFSVITISDGDELKIIDNTSTQYKFNVDPDTGLWTLDSEGAETLTGGCITGGNADNGAGVHISLGGTFTLSGGNIVGNSSSLHGGGVHLAGNDELDVVTKFIMTGGKIIGNCANSGAGVYVKEEDEFIMSGGSIEQNCATSKGAGVYVQDEGILRVSGSSFIKNNTADGEANNVVLDVDDEGDEAEFILFGKLTGDIRITSVFGKTPKSGAEFGEAEDDASGADHITADGTNLFGRISGDKLIWKAPSSGSSSKSQGTSIWLTAEPTQIPTETPTPTPMPTPAVKPVAETPTGKSPAPIAGVLAGLGAAAAAVFMRKRA